MKKISKYCTLSVTPRANTTGPFCQDRQKLSLTGPHQTRLAAAADVWFVWAKETKHTSTSHDIKGKWWIKPISSYWYRAWADRELRQLQEETENSWQFIQAQPLPLGFLTPSDWPYHIQNWMKRRAAVINTPGQPAKTLAGRWQELTFL